MQPLHTAILSPRATLRPAEMAAALLRLGADPLAACPDCYPSYARWKMQRGLHAMQVGKRLHSQLSFEGAAVGSLHGTPALCVLLA